MARSIVLPDADYLRRLGTAAYLVSSIEGLLLFDLPKWEQALPEELSVTRLAGKTTRKLGERFVVHGPRCTDDRLATYLVEGGRSLIGIADERNSILHARPATDESRRQRLYRWRPPEARFVTDEWLDDFAERVDQEKLRLMKLRPPFPPKASR